MALQVWLPLNGNLNNQGLSNVTVTNNGATVDNNGKIGKCYYFNGVSISSGNTSYISNFSLLNTNFSVAGWFKIVSSINSGSAEYLICLNNTTYSGDMQFAIAHRGMGLFVIVNNTEYTIQTLTVDIWYHISLTFDGQTSKVYINGNQVKSRNITSNPYIGNVLNIGSRSNSAGGNSHSYYSKIYVNDIRIYDNCLSPREVYEISKGLVLHYKLDMNGDGSVGNTNLVKNGWGGTENWNNTNYSTTELPPVAGITHSYYNCQTLEFIPIISNHTYELSCYIKAKAETGTCYVSMVPYDVDKLQITHEKMPGGFRASSLTTLAQDLNYGDRVIHLTDASGWANPTTHQYAVAIFGYRDSTGYEYPDLVYTRRTYGFGTSTDKSNLDIANNTVTLNTSYKGETIPAGTSICLTGFGAIYHYPITTTVAAASDWIFRSVDIIPQNVTYLKSAKYVRIMSISGNQYLAGITLKDKNADSIIYDCSGYRSNGTITGTLTLDSNTPRYNYSTLFNSQGLVSTTNSGSYILTMSIWAKDAGTIPANGLMFKDHLGDMALGIQSNVLYSGKHGGGGAGSKNISGINYTTNTWHHWVMVNRSGTYYVYMDGQQVLTGTSGAWSAGTVTNALHIGGRSGSAPWPGSLSDFRAYATALSESDILELYNTSTLIDDLGNGYSYEFNEKSINLFTLENWNEGARTAINYVDRNGSPSIPLNPINFYYGSGDSRNTQFKKKFAPNTQYKFDLWIDVDDVYYTAQNKNVEGGLRIEYSDGTNSYNALISTGNQSDPVGWIHKVYYSTAGKTISGIYVYYFIGINVYYRWDSIIIPLQNTTEIKKEGILSTGKLRENVSVAQIGKGDHFDNNQLIEI